VDGQNVTEVYEATSAAVARARGGEGPTLIEAITYRFDEHNVGLIIPGQPYRSDAEITRYKTERDPIKLFRAELIEGGIDPSELESIETEVDRSVQQAIEFAETSPLPDAATLRDYLYAN